MERKDYWAIIRQCIIDANEKEVGQDQIEAFLKQTFCKALNALDELVQGGMDLSDKEVVANLKDLELALHKVPQERIYAFDVSTVFRAFDENVAHFYRILSIPVQNAETSLSCNWIICRFESFVHELQFWNDSINTSEHALDELEAIKYSVKSLVSANKERKALLNLLNHQIKEQNKQLSRSEHEKVILKKGFADDLNKNYLAVCNNLISGGSDMVKSTLASALEGVAHAITSELMRIEARQVWRAIISLLSEENLRITQRKGRLLNAHNTLKNI